MYGVVFPILGQLLFIDYRLKEDFNWDDLGGGFHKRDTDLIPVGKANEPTVNLF